MTKDQECDTHGTCVFFTATAVRCFGAVALYWSLGNHDFLMTVRLMSMPTTYIYATLIENPLK
jgi:hypothetical protein